MMHVGGFCSGILMHPSKFKVIQQAIHIPVVSGIPRLFPNPKIVTVVKYCT